MFGLGMPEILLILAIALVVIGPKKLPDLAKTLGRAMGEFKRSAQDFKRSIDVETTVKDIKDVADPKIDLEGIIKETNIKKEPSTEDQSPEDPKPKDQDEADLKDTTAKAQTGTGENTGSRHSDKPHNTSENIKNE